jgi:hypothetical protein
MRWRRLAFGALLAAAALGLACHRPGAEGGGGVGAVPTPGRTEKVKVSLLFPGGDGFLHAEERELVLPLEPDGRVQAVVAALLAGPKSDGLVAPLPAAVGVADAFVDTQGVAYVDLGAKDQAEPPPSGSDLELLRVYSLVNTVLANEPRVRGVVLLWNGDQRPTFAGHVDTGSPLLANRRLVR